jgi:hypothetical protein
VGVPNQQQQPQSNVNVMTNVIVDKVGNFDNSVEEVGLCLSTRRLMYEEEYYRI